MKIALLGYGKMGKVIERMALERGHEIVLRKGSGAFDGLENADVAIDFSVPDAAVGNISACLNSKVPVVSGTTGWLDQYEKMTALCDENRVRSFTDRISASA
jgi:4-hydroxy-tetrahydrodipicolinate reductase